MTGLLPYLKLGTLASLPWLAPELWLTAGLVVVLFWDLFRPAPGGHGAGILTLLFLAAAMIHTVVLWAGGFPGHGVSLMSGMMAADPLASFFKLVCLLAAAFAVLFSFTYSKFAGRRMGEFYTLLLGVALGMSLMTGATHFLMFYLALELVSYLSYPLVGYVKEDRRASEASLKYVLYGSVSSGAMIFGISILYGVTGKLDLASFSQVLSASMPGQPALLVGILLVMAGLGYKIAAVPFHFWCPDVYEGANTPMTAFLSVGPKAAGFALLCRFAYDGLLSGTRPLPGIGWETLAATLSVLTMTLGNLVALQQTSIKRMLAYSSIAHAGYMLMAFAVPGEKAVSAVLLYLAVYLFMNLGAFFVLIALSGRVDNEETLDGFRGLGYRYPLVAILMGLFLLSLTGIPPTAGFIGKLYLFSALIDARLYWLAVVGVLNSVVSLYYYARVLKVMFLEQPAARPVLVGVGADVHRRPVGSYPMAILWILGVPTFLLGIFWGPLADLVQAGVRGFF